jgi:hypothetical protein
MDSILGVFQFVIFTLLSIIHFYWGAGGKRWKNNALPQNNAGEVILKPAAIDCFAVAIVLLVFAVFSLIKTDIISFSLPDLLSSYGMWSISVLFLLRAIGDFKYLGFFKKLKHTDFADMDSKYYSPLCLLLAISASLTEVL